MNKDRVEGSLEQAKGKVKEVAGKATGDSKLETEGKAQQVAGKVQNAVGGLKDAVKEASRLTAGGPRGLNMENPALAPGFLLCTLWYPRPTLGARQ